MLVVVERLFSPVLDFTTTFKSLMETAALVCTAVFRASERRSAGPSGELILMFTEVRDVNSGSVNLQHVDTQNAAVGEKSAFCNFSNKSCRASVCKRLLYIK